MFQLPSFATVSGFVHGFSEVADGNMAFTWGTAEVVVENRRRFLNTLGVPFERCVVMHIEHGTTVAVVGEDDAGRGMEDAETAVRADALVTTTSGLALFLLTADCLPIIFYDPVRRAVGLAHVSRLNATSGLVAKIVGAMVARGCTVKDLIVGIGPAIHKESYIFPDDASHAWMPRFGRHAHMVGGGATAIDLIGYAVDEFVKSGVPVSSIAASEVDVGADPRFFSHRRSEVNGEPEGRMATVAGLR
jgi:hypothetical protein